MTDLVVTRTLTIPQAELQERFVHASGPGGQNVNKLATAVQLRFDIAGSPALPETVRRRLLALPDRRIGRDGVLVLTARRFRTQERNRQDARERLAALIRAALVPPRPRRATAPTAASRERRLEGKARRAGVKRSRTRPTE
jgi:ribosome-associated protein